MCGIFGIAISSDSNYTSHTLMSTVNELFRLSESRGKEASGVAVQYGKAISVYKEPVSASRFIRTKKYKEIFASITQANPSVNNNHITFPITIIGHSRLVTEGTQKVNDNNQPLIKDGIIGIHNGIVVNADGLWRCFPPLERKYEVDTEIIFSLTKFFYREKGSLLESIREVFSFVQGATSIALLFEDVDCLILATNNGSLYVCTNSARNIFIFASELNILKVLIRKRKLEKILETYKLFHVKARQGCVIYSKNRVMKEFSLDTGGSFEVTAGKDQLHYDINTIVVDNEQLVDRSQETSLSGARPFLKKEILVEDLRRCTKCILPETMPFIQFDKEGVCNYCKSYKKSIPKGLDAIEKIIKKYRSSSGEPDCIVGISGGRDSTYGLHYIKMVLKMNPIAYTYDWGMVTDLARRNISKICGRLGIEHIVVSADIQRKRWFIKNNVEAWLRKPDLGLVPLFMAGDKQYFYYANKVKKQTGVNLVFLCENMLERTDFKSGFCGIKPYGDEDYVYTLSLINKIRFAVYYLRHYLLNPAYLNQSLLDTLWAYFCYYFMPRDYINLYRFINWDEREIVATLKDEYGWGSADDTVSTWRIGDGTAAFYNYIYFTVAGFTEHDTFRSNQVREGILSRKEALDLVKKENLPRYDSIAWYCKTIGLDFDKAIAAINSIPKRYRC